MNVHFEKELIESVLHKIFDTSKQWKPVKSKNNATIEHHHNIYRAITSNSSTITINDYYEYLKRKNVDNDDSKQMLDDDHHVGYQKIKKQKDDNWMSVRFQMEKYQSSDGTIYNVIGNIIYPLSETHSLYKAPASHCNRLKYEFDAQICYILPTAKLLTDFKYAHIKDSNRLSKLSMANIKDFHNETEKIEQYLFQNAVLVQKQKDDEKENELNIIYDQDILEQLINLKVGTRSQIFYAMDNVVNRHDINEIIDFIQNINSDFGVVRNRRTYTETILQNITMIMNPRDLWIEGCECEIYSTSHNKWFRGRIQQILYDSKGECLRVVYNNNLIKNIKRNDENNIRPIQDVQEQINELKSNQNEMRNTLSNISSSLININKLNLVSEIKEIYNDKYKAIFYKTFVTSLMMAFFDSKAILSEYVKHEAVFRNKAMNRGWKMAQIATILCEEIPLARMIMELFIEFGRKGYDVLILQKCANHMIDFEIKYCLNGGQLFSKQIAVNIVNTKYISNEIKKLSKSKENEKNIINKAKELSDYILSLISAGYIQAFMENFKIENDSQFLDILSLLILIKAAAADKKNKTLNKKQFKKIWNSDNLKDVTEQISSNIKGKLSDHCQHFKLDELLKKMVGDMTAESNPSSNTPATKTYSV